MELSKEDFFSWKANPVTEKFMNLVKSRIEDAKEILSVSAGQEPSNDRLLVGMIKAFNEVLEVSYEVATDDVSDSVASQD